MHWQSLDWAILLSNLFAMAISSWLMLRSGLAKWRQSQELLRNAMAVPAPAPAPARRSREAQAAPPVAAEPRAAVRQRLPSLIDEPIGPSAILTEEVQTVAVATEKITADEETRDEEAEVELPSSVPHPALELISDDDYEDLFATLVQGMDADEDGDVIEEETQRSSNDDL